MKIKDKKSLRCRSQSPSIKSPTKDYLKDKLLDLPSSLSI
jgi:hypothetical protein